MIYPSILPPASTPLERALEQIAARMLDIMVPLRDLWSPDTCPPALLPWLAWALSIDEWDTGWSDEQKRATVRASLSVHRRKGTIGAVREAVAALAIDVQAQEWFNQIPAADPYTFRLLLTADQVGIDRATFAMLLAIVRRTQNLRSHLTDIQLTARSLAGPRMAAAAGLGTDIAVQNYVPPRVVLTETAICF